MTVFLAIIAVILLFGMIGDKEQKNRDNYTMAFVANLAAIVILSVLK